jgi:hypothetical protein
VEKKRTWRGLRWGLGLLLLTCVSGFLPTISDAAVIVFLRSGRAIQAEGTEIIGNRIRIQTPTEMIELSQSAVLSTHQVLPPTSSPSNPPPAAVYQDITQQMLNKVRNEIPPPGAPRGK